MQQQLDINFEQETMNANKDLGGAELGEADQGGGNESGNMKVGTTRAREQETSPIDEFKQEEDDVEEEKWNLSAHNSCASHEAQGEAKDAANAKRIIDLTSELNSVKESLCKSNTELEIKQQKIDFLEQELRRVTSMETELAEKDVLLAKLKHELHTAREETHPIKMEPEDRRIKELEETKALLEEAKSEIMSLQKNVQTLEDSVAKSHEDVDAMRRSLDQAKLDLNSTKEQLAHAQEEGELSSLKVKGLNQEISILRNEVNSATEAEEKSKKAMDDLALVLIEVTKENKEVKENLSSTKSELDSAREETENLKKQLKSIEDKYQSLLEEAKKEIEQLKSECERLKLDAEDSILAWNQKELEFVGCIKRADEECDAAKEENKKLKASLRTSEDAANAARDENCKLRDILKQAINESSVAQETAEIAKAENSQLKEELSDKEDVLEELTREIERLRIKETASHETIKELKMLLSSKSENDTKVDNMESERIKKRQNSFPEHNDNQNIKEILKIKFEEPQLRATVKKENEDPEIDEMLRGSIFDVAESPVAAPRPVSHHRKMSSTVFSDAEEDNFHDLEQPADAASPLEDMDDKNGQRKKRALIRRFGDLMRITSLIRREAPVS